MHKLTEIMDPYFRDDRRPLREVNDMPVAVSKSEWVVKEDPERLSRKFDFKNEEALRSFTNEILIFQRGFGHHAKLILDGKSVTIEVFTHNIEKITGLDKEYASMADQIYVDVQNYEER